MILASNYFFIDKTEPISKLRRGMVDENIRIEARICRAYNWNGREAGRVVKATFDGEIMR